MSPGKYLSSVQTLAFHVRNSSNGNVTQGILSILSELPIVSVNVKDLPALCSDPGEIFLLLTCNDLH